jgi:hypothetical protein
MVGESTLADAAGRTINIMPDIVNALKVKGIQPPLTIPDDLVTCPHDVRELARVAALGYPNPNKLEAKTKIHVLDIEDSQGVVFGENNTLYISNAEEGSDNVHIIKARPQPSGVVVEKKIAIRPIVEQLGLPFSGRFWHVGAPSYARGLLFIALSDDRTPKEDPLLLAFSRDLDLVGGARLAYKPSYQVHPNPGNWCAHNPWDGLLYVDVEGPEARMAGYDVSLFYSSSAPRTQGFVPIDHEPKKVIALTNVAWNIDVLGRWKQGVSFSKNGLIYWSTSDKNLSFSNKIHVYCALRGISIGVWEHDFEGIGDEIEGTTSDTAGRLYCSVCVNEPGADGCDLYLLAETSGHPL